MSVIDHVATTCARNISKYGVLTVSLTDHFMVYCIRKYNGGVAKDHKIIKTREIKHFDQQAVLSNVPGIWWGRGDAQ